MRKSHEKVCRAFLAGLPASAGSVATNGKELWLHGNAIARWERDVPINMDNGWADPYIVRTWAGYPTATTTAALNALAECAEAKQRHARRRGACIIFTPGDERFRDTEVESSEWWVLA